MNYATTLSGGTVGYTCQPVAYLFQVFRKVAEMGKIHDLTGKRFGMLEVLKFVEVKNRFSIWLCKCDCGITKQMRGNSLVSGSSSSCGCKSKENRFQATHRMVNTPEYNSWHGAKARCNNNRCKDYPKYGGRGIRFSKEWDDFVDFLRDMGEKPSPEHTLERVDVDGDYSPSNCIWATPQEQAENRRNNVNITYKGKTMCASRWAKKIGVSHTAIYTRMKKGLSVSDVLSPSKRVSPRT